jgi:hypothetical protein
MSNWIELISDSITKMEYWSQEYNNRNSRNTTLGTQFRMYNRGLKQNVVKTEEIIPEEITQNGSSEEGGKEEIKEAIESSIESKPETTGSDSGTTLGTPTPHQESPDPGLAQGEQKSDNGSEHERSDPKSENEQESKSS